MERQRQIDFTRAEQIALLRGACFEPVTISDGKNVKQASLKAVLFAIDSRAGKGTCWASLDTLATDAGLSRRTVVRVLEALEQLSLVIRQTRREGRSNVIHRRIVFPNLADFQSATGTVHSATGTVHSATGTVHSATGTSSQCNGDQFTVQPLHPKYPLRVQEAQKKLHEGDGGVLKTSRRAGGLETLQAGLQAADLSDALRVDQLWRIAVQRGLLPETGFWRETFFGLCKSMHRRRQSLINCIGLLHRKLADGQTAVLQQVDDETDRAWARKAISELDGTLPARPAQADCQASDLREFDSFKREQMQRLAAAFPEELKR